MSPERQSLNAAVVRHGEVAELSRLIENDVKPPYEEFVAYQEGTVDPPIDKEGTKKLILDKVSRGEISPPDFDIIITSPKLRTRQTGELFNEVFDRTVPIHTSRYLKEVNVPMGDVTPEFYAQAPNLSAVRKKQMELLATGKKVDENILDVYHRAERFLNYFKRIGKSTAKHPLFITHAIFSRFLSLAINHQNENLNDEQTRAMILREFSSTQRPEVIGGFELSTSEQGIQIVKLI